MHYLPLPLPLCFSYFSVPVLTFTHFSSFKIFKHQSPNILCHMGLLMEYKSGSVLNNKLFSLVQNFNSPPMIGQEVYSIGELTKPLSLLRWRPPMPTTIPPSPDPVGLRRPILATAGRTGYCSNSLEETVKDIQKQKEKNFKIQNIIEDAMFIE